MAKKTKSAKSPLLKKWVKEQLAKPAKKTAKRKPAAKRRVSRRSADMVALVERVATLTERVGTLSGQLTRACSMAETVHDDLGKFAMSVRDIKHRADAIEMHCSDIRRVDLSTMIEPLAKLAAAEVNQELRSLFMDFRREVGAMPPTKLREFLGLPPLVPEAEQRPPQPKAKKKR